MWDFLSKPNNVCLISETGEMITYAELHQKIEEFAAICQARSLVFCLCANVPGTVLGYTAMIKKHIVPVMLDAKLDREMLHSLTSKYHPAYYWCPDKTAEEFPSFRKIYSSWGYSLLQTDCSPFYPLHESLALLLTTSGSTGSPKLVRQSYRNIEANTASIVEYLHLTETERAITTLPLNYTYGLSILNTHLEVGAAVIMTEKTLMQKEFWDIFRTYKATSFGGVPYTYEMLDRLRFSRMKLESLRYTTQAGGKLPANLHCKFAELAAANGRDFIVMYGQTEATARMSYLPASMAVKKKGSIGIAIPGGKFTLLDSSNQPIVTPHTTGELVYEGENVTMGYAECGSDLINGDMNKGVLHTGDMAQYDEDGYYYIVGRKKRFLKVFGSRVNLDEIEQILKREYNNLECACGGQDDNVYVFYCSEIEQGTIRAMLSTKMHLNPIAFHVKRIPAIPKNSSGKTIYTELERYYD